MPQIIPISHSQNRFALDINFSQVDEQPAEIKGQKVLKLSYRDNHCIYWKIGQIAFAALLTLVTLGFALCFSAGKRLWTNAIDSFKLQVVHEIIQETPGQKTPAVSPTTQVTPVVSPTTQVTPVVSPTTQVTPIDIKQSLEAWKKAFPLIPNTNSCHRWPTAFIAELPAQEERLRFEQLMTELTKILPQHINEVFEEFFGHTTYYDTLLSYVIQFLKNPPRRLEAAKLLLDKGAKVKGNLCSSYESQQGTLVIDIIKLARKTNDQDLVDLLEASPV